MNQHNNLDAIQWIRDEWIPLFSDIRIVGYLGYLNIMDTWIVGYQGYSFFWIRGYLDTMDINFLHYPDNR